MVAERARPPELGLGLIGPPLYTLSYVLLAKQRGASTKSWPEEGTMVEAGSLGGSSKMGAEPSQSISITLTHLCVATERLDYLDFITTSRDAKVRKHGGICALWCRVVYGPAEPTGLTPATLDHHVKTKPS